MVASSIDVYKIFGRGNCFVLVCKCNKIFLFFVTEGNLTPFYLTSRARKIFEFHLAYWASNPQILLARGTSLLAQVFKLINNS